MRADRCLSCQNPLTGAHLLAGHPVVCCPKCSRLQTPDGERPAAPRSLPVGFEVHEDAQGWGVRWWRADPRGVTSLFLGLFLLFLVVGISWSLLRSSYADRGVAVAMGVCAGSTLLLFAGVSVSLVVKGLGALLDRVEVRATAQHLTWAQRLLGLGRRKSLGASELVHVEAVQVLLHAYGSEGMTDYRPEYCFDLRARSRDGATHTVVHGLRSPLTALWMAEQLAQHLQRGSLRDS